MIKLPITLFLLIAAVNGYAIRDEHCGQAIPVASYVANRVIPGLNEALSHARGIPLNVQSTSYVLSLVMATTVRESPYSTLSFRDVESGLRSAASDIWLVAAPKNLSPTNVTLRYPEKLKPHRGGSPEYGLLIIVGAETIDGLLRELGTTPDENLERLRNTGWFIPHGEG